MSVHILDAMAREGFEEVLAIHDRRSGLRGFLGIHSTERGPAFGGIRRWEYRDEHGALLDCLRLARSMTHKCALAGLPAGGAKLVLLDRDGVDWDAGYRHLGKVIERLAGRYYAGPDVGTTDEDLSRVVEGTRYVTDPGPDGPGELSEATAEGVFRAIESALRHLDGDVDWPSLCVVVQGLGSVGMRLAERLVERGARVVASDLDPARAEAAQARLGVELVNPSEELDVPCDVFAPCALGGLLHDLTLERLRCRVVAGGANNVLARPLHGDLLHERGILYVPDFVLNSGALIRGTHFHLEGRRLPVETIGRRIGECVASILERAAREDAPPARVAIEAAEERLADAREGRRVETIPE